MLDPTTFGSISNLLIMRLSNLSQNVTGASPLVQRFSLPSFSSPLLSLSIFFSPKSISYQLKLRPLTVAEEKQSQRTQLYAFPPCFTVFYLHHGLPSWLSSTESACHCRQCKRLGFNPWVRKIPQRSNGNPLQYFCLKNPMDRRARQAIVHRVAKSQT